MAACCPVDGMGSILIEGYTLVFFDGGTLSLENHEKLELNLS